MPRAVSLARLCAAALALGAGGLLALAVLAAAGAMPWRAAILAAAALVAGLVWRLWRPMSEAAALAAIADRAGASEAPAAARTPEIAEIAAGVARARADFRLRPEELARRAAAAEGILEALPDPVLLLDRDRRVARANPAARALLGVDPTGNDLAGVLRAPPVLAAADAVLADGAAREVPYRIEVPIERHFGVLIAPIAGSRDEKGPRAVVRLVDLTAVKRAEEMRADFAANASHELKTPLSALIGFIETLRGPARGDPQAQERFLGLMAAQAERMARLVNDLLALSSIELVEHAPPTAPVALSAIARAAAQALEIRAGERRMTIDVVVDDGLPPVSGDADQLAQLVQNLLDNALKYGAEGTTVTLRLALVPAPPGMESAGKAVALSVADRGDGIPEEHIPRLTERFYRVDSARSRAAGGTGLGLAIVKHILSRHRGQLKIDSTVGVGSTFTAYLPAGRGNG
jgi:two-component system, OmpR family, phosphate regulon sensor histidine kinase PhoR